MNKPTLVQQLRSMADELDKHPAIKVLECTFAPGATDAQLGEAGKNFVLTPAMRAFYTEANGLCIRWECQADKHLPQGGAASGSIRLVSVEEVFGDWEDEIYSEENETYKQLHPLDFFIEEACAAFLLDGSANPEVYYHYLGEEMGGLGVDFTGYIKLLLKSRGFWYWQQAIARPEEKTQTPQSPSVEEGNFRTIMPALFPDFRDSDFQRSQQPLKGAHKP